MQCVDIVDIAKIKRNLVFSINQNHIFTVIALMTITLRIVFDIYMMTRFFI